MAYTSEIEKLERRNAENPQGRLFAPLADAYRKQGELERAMTLLREGLQRHPDYIGAQIVLGRCLLDLGEEAEASAAFQRVLDLDGENVIALKALAEIAERGGRRAEAVARLERLLEIDRGNEEALAQIEALRARPEPAGGLPPAPAAPAVSGERPGPVATVESAAAEAAGEGEPMPPPAGIELHGGFGAGAGSNEEPAPPPPIAGLEVPAAAARDLEVEPVEGLLAPELEGEEFLLERETDILLEGSAENEFQSRSDAERLAAPEVDAGTPNPWQNLAAETVPPPIQPAEPIEMVPWEDEDEEGAAAEPPTLEELDLVEAVAPEPAPGRGPEPEPEPEPAPAVAEPAAVLRPAPAVEEPEDAGEPELVITETMAAVYERQGLRHEALRVYRELTARRPDDPRLAAKLAALEAEAPAPSAPVPSAGRTAGYAAGETGGDSLGGFLRGILGARLAAPGASAPVPARAEYEEAGLDAAPTRPAADPVSLSAVFGDDLPPAAPAASATGPSGGQGFSFDAFFGTGGAPAREGARPPAGGEDDLEQFHAWLQGLKK